MLNEFTTSIAVGLQQAGYLTELDPRIPGVQALLYARSPRRVRVGVARIEDHFLFVDWENAAFGRLDQLKEMYARFSRFANQGFQTPHALRLQLPNLALVALSPTGFPEEAAQFAAGTSLTPWYGGEVGQLILVDIENKQMISLGSLPTERFPRWGAFALGHAASLIWKVVNQIFGSGI